MKLTQATGLLLNAGSAKKRLGNCKMGLPLLSVRKIPFQAFTSVHNGH